MIEFRKVLALRGPNLWAGFSVLEAWIELTESWERATNEVAGFDDRLMNWLPTLIEHRCSLGERGGFFESLRRGTTLAHAIEHVTLELQTLAGTEVGFGRARETKEPGVFKVAIEYVDETVARDCLETARRLCQAAIDGTPFDVRGEIARLQELCQDVCLGPSTRSIVEAARKRGIPFRRLNTANLVQFGYGCHQRRIMAAETDRTGAIAESIAQDKDLTRKLLAECGLPVPEGYPVDSAEEAWEAAEDIGLPVVVKPQDGNQGRGVATNLQSREQVLAAYASARDESRRVIVEKFAPGVDYRLLVVGDRVVAASRRDPAQVVGDGVRTVNELIDVVNSDPRRGEHHGTVLSRIHLDDVSRAVLADQGLDEHSVPAAGRTVLIRRNANLSTGGTAVDVTDLVHPSVRNRAVEAAKIVGLDVAGLDVVACDIAQPLESQGGVIVEINAAPGLRMHLAPSAGVARPVGEAIVELLYPGNASGRVPIVAVTGVNGKTTTTRFIAHLLKGTGRSVGMTSTDGIYIDDQRIDSGDCSGPKSARAVLANPRVEAAVFETARGGILREGLGFDRCDVAVVTNIGEGDHLGLSGIDTLEQLAEVKRVIVEAVGPHGTAVLNAADPLVVAMADRCPGRVAFFGVDETLPAIVANRERGERATFVRDGWIVLAEGPTETPLIPLDRVPLTHAGAVRFQVENTLAAVAAAWALGLPADMLVSRLDLFAANLEQVPGRFNVFDVQGTTVVLDYGHNASALSALIEAIGRYPHPKRTIVYSTAGDRRDCDIVRQGELLGAAFDRVILYEDHYKRGRRDGEIIGLFREGVVRGTRATHVEDIQGAVRSVEYAFETMRPGELLVIQPDVVDETVDFLRSYLLQLASRARPVHAPRVDQPERYAEIPKST